MTSEPSTPIEMVTRDPPQAQRVLAALGARGSDGGTCQEVERTLRLGHRTVSARLRELENHGYIVKTPRTRRIWGGRPARVYAITLAGTAALASAQQPPADRRES